MPKLNLFKSLLALTFVFNFQSCSDVKKMDNQNNKFDLQGHRGCRGLMPENTIPAMIQAIDLDVNTLEMDVVITKDLKVVLSHEPFFNHEISTKPDGNFVSEAEERSLNIYRMSYDELSKYDIGMKPHPRFPQQQKIKVGKPLLEKLVDSVESYCSLQKKNAPFYNIEIKSQATTDDLFHPKPEVFADLVVKTIQDKGIAHRNIIQSFDFRPLQYIHKRYPELTIALLIEGDDKRSFEEQLKELGFTPAIYSPEYNLVTKELVQKCHALKMKIIPWTVNDAAIMKSLQQMGVDGLITDYPDLFQ